MKFSDGLNLNSDVFRAVIEIEQCGSISHAAENLFVSQPNLSAQIKRLEQGLGYPIFERSSTGVKTTEQGKLFLDSARIIASELYNIRDIPHLLENSGGDDLSIVCVYSVVILNRFLDFRQALPASKDLFKETGLHSALEDIVNKRYRIGFIYEFEDHFPQLEEFGQRYLLDFELLVPNIPVLAVVHKNHPLARLDSVPLEALTNTPLVAFEYLRNENWLAEMGLNNPREAMYVFDRGGALEIIAHGRHVGISIGVPFVGMNKQELVCIPISGIEKHINQYWMKPTSYQLTSTEQSFMRYLAAEDRVVLKSLER